MGGRPCLSPYAGTPDIPHRPQPLLNPKRNPTPNSLPSKHSSPRNIPDLLPRRDRNILPAHSPQKRIQTLRMPLLLRPQALALQALEPKTQYSPKILNHRSTPIREHLKALLRHLTTTVSKVMNRPDRAICKPKREAGQRVGLKGERPCRHGMQRLLMRCRMHHRSTSERRCIPREVVLPMSGIGKTRNRTR
jgi:hypothetical protein